MVESKEDKSILSNHLAGVSQKSSSGILPPEMVTRVNRSNLDSVLQCFEKYWGDVLSDSLDFGLLNSDDVHTISSVIQSFLDEDNALKRARGVLGTLTNKMNHSFDDMSEVSWRDKLSDSLQGINFIDLPHSLAECQTIYEFHDIWDRMKTNSEIWERIRPRLDEHKTYAYFVKHHDDSASRKEHDELPFTLVQSTCSVDIWSFGVLMFFMCSRMSLFHTTIDGHLQSYEELYKWNTEKSKARISSCIKDPIAQDLLMKILVPKEERISSLDEILQHPYFGPSSSLEAQQILEDHAERQLQIMDCNPRQQINTHDIEKVRLLSMEKYCKIVFERSSGSRVGDVTHLLHRAVEVACPARAHSVVAQTRDRVRHVRNVRPERSERNLRL